MIGIPPSPLMIASFACENTDKEKDIGKSTMSAIGYDRKDDIKSEYRWIFSEQNIMSSKTRVCHSCYGECTHPHSLHTSNVLLRYENTVYRVRVVKFAVKEHQRLHTKVKPSMSDYEKYIITLPDRSNIDWDPFGMVDELNNYDHVYFEDAMWNSLKGALIPDYKSENKSCDTELRALSQEFRTEFIQDKNRIIPNDQELTRWMKKKINGYCYDKKIQYCKIFSNSKKHEVDPSQYTKYTVVVHYSTPKGYWEEYDI